MPGAAGAAAAVGAAAYHLINHESKEDEAADKKDDKAWESDGEQGRLRARKLEALSEKELSPSMMRSLFRLLDGDGSFELSAQEIQKGMLLLGFSDAADPVAMTRLLQDIDEDRTGTITEGEFMNWGAGQTRASVMSVLKSYVTHQVAITATFFGQDAHGQRVVRTESVPQNKLKEWIASQPAARGRLWLDVVGYAPDTHAVLATSLGLSHATVSNSILVQPPGARVIGGVNGGAPVAEIIVHCLTCSSDPLVDGAGANGCCGRGKTAGDGTLDSRFLASKAHIVANPPAISMEQAALVITDDRTLVTLRSPAFGGEQSSTSAGQGAGSGAAVHPELSTPAMKDPSTIRLLYSELRARMQAGTTDTAPLFSGSIKALAVAIIDLILQRNFQLRDGLTDWQEVLEREIRKQPNSLHTPHLDALGKMAQGALRALEPLGQALNPAEWPHEVVQPEPDGPDTPSIDDVPLLRTQASSRSVEHDGKSEMADRLRHVMSSGSASGEIPSGSLAQFFGGYRADFREMAEDVTAIATAVGEHRKDVERLTGLLGSLKADFMNRTLFALTLITAVSVPVTFLTGLWGMNFEDMHELQDPNVPGSAGFGYKTFWISMSSVVLLEIVGMQAMGLFEALR